MEELTRNTGKMTNIYLADTAFLDSDEVFSDALDKVSSFRREKVLKYRFRKDRNLSLLAGLLLDRGLSAYGLSEKDSVFEVSEKGKPYLKDHPEIFFSLSHSGTRAAAVFSDRPCGIDIEKIEGDESELAKRFFHEEEYRYLRSLEDVQKRTADFYRIWTAKESYLKMLGTGLSVPLDSFEIRLDTGRPILYEDGEKKEIFFTEIPVMGYSLDLCLQ